MVWKTGKFGVHSGKTVRSRRSHPKRSEGLLIQTTVENACRKEEQDEGESITYSLGKQNRWLLPEIIKTTSFDLEEREFLGHGDEVVLVERFSNAGNEKRRRPDCFSVFDSSNSSTRKSKRRLARAEDLLSDIKSMKTKYEVSYPHPAGSWPHERESSTRKHRTRLGGRKKDTFLNRTIEEDLSELSNTETLFHIDTDDLRDDDQPHYSRMGVPLTFDLKSLICNSAKKSKNSLKVENGSMQVKSDEECKRTKFGKGEAIYRESGDGMHDAHQSFLAMAEETQPTHMDDWHYHYQPVPERRRIRRHERGRGRGRGRGQGRGRGGYNGYQDGRIVDDETFSSLRWSTDSTDPFVTPVEPVQPVKPVKISSQWVSLVLQHQDINLEFLQETWGSMYKEAGCFPRAFFVNVTPQILSSSTKELFVLLRLAKGVSENVAAGVGANIYLVGISNDEYTSGLVQKEFISHIKAKTSKTEIWSLKDIVNVAKTCFLKSITDETEPKEPRKSRFSLGVFTELFGWKSEALSLEAAQKEIKTSCIEKTNKSHKLVTMATADCQHQTECGICFMPFECEDPIDTLSYTFLISCGHKFCDDCWRGHLKTQLQQGHTNISCPGYKCTVAVDDVTLMSLLPTWYGKFVTKKLDKILEIHPEWKWCPEDRCTLVVKATTPQSTTDLCDEHVGSPQPVPVVCVCGSMWCFKCQEDAHWPATCEEAKTFRENTKGYAKMVARNQTSPLITSVQIKNCPFCHYPIQKGPGCNHMMCGLCSKEFCWFCLEKWSWDHICKEKVGHNEVELPVDTKHLRSYEHLAVTSRMARSTSVIRRINEKLGKLDRGLNSYRKLPAEVRRDTGKSGRPKKELNRMLENNSLDVLREVFGFKFQAVLAVEGLAMVLSISRDAPNKRLALEFERLVFIVERLDDMLKDFNKCHHRGRLERLKLFLKFGKQSLILIGKNKITG